MKFSEIFAEYFSLFRGQGSAIPTFGDREFTSAIYACRNAIRKWAKSYNLLKSGILVSFLE